MVVAVVGYRIPTLYCKENVEAETRVVFLGNSRHLNHLHTLSHREPQTELIYGIHNQLLRIYTVQRKPFYLAIKKNWEYRRGR